jgi:Fungal protein kinase
VAGRATTCWKAYREGDESQTPLVVKDSWQYPEREEEGELLREATKKEVVNVARYYHHETVRVGGQDDNICKNVRKGLDITRATNYNARGSVMSPKTSRVHDTLRKGRSTSTAGQKRSSSHADISLPPPSKRTCSSSPTKGGGDPADWDRVHRRVILSDYGKPLYKASSRVAMLTALEGCIEGYESLYTQTDMLQSDISIGNLMMNEDKNNPSWQAFIIDLDLAIKEQREESSGARGKTGTRAFMAIGVLYGEKHSFMHDLESFFWVFFWICIHYNGPNEKSRVVSRFEKWNYADIEELAELKKGTVSHEGDFKKTIDENFTLYYHSLRPWMNRLRKVVFPNGGRWEKDDMGLYSRMKKILREAQEDPKVLAEARKESQVLQD